EDRRQVTARDDWFYLLDHYRRVERVLAVTQTTAAIETKGGGAGKNHQRARSAGPDAGRATARPTLSWLSVRASTVKVTIKAQIISRKPAIAKLNAADRLGSSNN